jgi:hypothetical protein
MIDKCGACATLWGMVHKRHDPKAARLLEAMGLALFGEHFMGPLADALEVNRETIRRWLKGDTPLDCTHTVFNDLLTISADRVDEIVAARRAIKDFQKQT